CSANPTHVALYLSGMTGLSVGHRTPSWLPTGGELDIFSAGQLTGFISIDLRNFKISGDLQPLLRLSAVAAVNLSTALGILEGAAVAFALYDPFLSNDLVIITGVGAGVG